MRSKYDDFLDFAFLFLPSKGFGRSIFGGRNFTFRIRDFLDLSQDLSFFTQTRSLLLILIRTDLQSKFASEPVLSHPHKKL